MNQTRSRRIRAAAGEAFTGRSAHLYAMHFRTPRSLARWMRRHRVDSPIEALLTRQRLKRHHPTGGRLYRLARRVHSKYSPWWDAWTKFLAGRRASSA